MSPREKIISSSFDSFISGDTTVLHTPDGAPFVVCKSDKPFVNPTTPEDVTPEEINRQLNLDLGQRIVTRRNTTLLWIIDFMDKLFFQWWEKAFFNFWSEMVPLSFRRFITQFAWKCYFPIHKAILGKRTGLHPTQSYEYHAITTVMWWARFIAVTPQRMRFSLSQLYVIAPNDPPTSDRTTSIYEIPKFLRDDAVPPEQNEACTVKGLYIHRHNKHQATEKIIFWIYGGAYLAGDARGNSASADWIGSRCDLDVFIPSYYFISRGWF